MARVQLVEKEKAPPEVKEIFQKIEDNGATILNLYKTVANSPELVLNFIRLGNSIMARMELSPRWRELIILRVAKLNNCEYERAAHTAIALEVGVSQQQMDTIADWQNSPEFSDEERAILQYTDEVTRNVRVTDQTFSTLRRFLNEQAIVEVTLTAGFYGMAARVLVPLQVELDENATGSVTELTGKRNQPK